jgi:heparanase 1
MYSGPTGPRGKCTSTDFPHVDICVNDALWDDINAFMTETGFQFVYDLPVKARNGDNTWNSTNSEELLAYTAKKGYKLAAWQLGNEVEDMYKSHLNFTGETIGNDYHTLRKLLSKYPTQQTIYGPDSCCERNDPNLHYNGEFLIDFTKAAIGAVDAITIHDYPLPRNATNRACLINEYTNITQMETLENFLVAYRGYVAAGGGEAIPVILGETASTAQGGCDGLSNRFISGFVFMYELGSVAESRIVQMNRQDLIGWSSEGTPSGYAVLGSAGWISTAVSGPPTPHPDYFIALLWKQLVGTTVLSSAASVSMSSEWNSHMWCSKGKTPLLSFINLGAKDEVVHVNTIPAGVSRTEYFITSSADNIYSEEMPQSFLGNESYLNGKLMYVNPDGTLPQFPFAGRRVVDGSTLVVPARSYGFVTFDGAAPPPACQPATESI